MFHYMKIRIPNEHLYMKLLKAIDEAPSIPPCQTTDPELWYSDKNDVGLTYRQAREFCTQCPVMVQCANYAIEAGEADGVWGGLTPRDRMKMRAAKGRIKKYNRRVA